MSEPLPPLHPSIIRIQTDYPLRISTRRPLRIEHEGDIVTVVIEGIASDAQSASEPSRTQKQEPEDSTTIPNRNHSPANLPNRCGVIMVRAGKPCARVAGHRGVHMGAEQVARKQQYNKERARERYAEDPEYAKRIRAQVRASSQRRQGEEPATE